MIDAQYQIQEQVDSSASKSKKIERKRLLIGFALSVFFLSVLYVMWVVFFNRFIGTNNAYVGAESAQITSMVNGQVTHVLVKDTQLVQRGDVLVQLDNRDAKIVLAQAQAKLMKAQRQYRQTAANSRSLVAQMAVRDDEIRSAQAQLSQAQANYEEAALELKRRKQLAASGAVSKEELTKAQSAVATAEAGLAVAKSGLAQASSSHKAAESNLAANEALIRGVTETTTPDVKMAQAQVDQALLDLERTVIRAPITGVITRRNIQVGQRVGPGTSMMMIVPIHDLYVDANFKESQLSKVRAGQSVILTADLYGNSVKYHGKVLGFSGGTGSAFALIPAQNATGNWIKVVQRLPVRIALDPQELAKHPLRVGLSMNVKIDLSSKQ